MKRDLAKSDVNEMDYANYIASSSDEESGEGEYTFDAAPLPSKKPAGSGLRDLMSQMRADADSMGEREMTFHAEAKGGEGRGKKNGDLPPSVWEVAQAKQKEKKAKRKQQKARDVGGGDSEDELYAGGEEEDDIPDELRQDPFFAEAIAEREKGEAAARKRAGREGTGGGGPEVQEKREAVGKEKKGSKGKGKGKGGKRERELSEEEREEQKKRRAELELLLMESEDGARHFETKNLLIGDRRKGKKAKRAKEGREEGGEEGGGEDTFKLDVSDPRFSRIFESSDFAIDPTDPKFKRTNATDGLLAEIQKKHERGQVPLPAAEAPVVSSMQRLVSSVKSATKRNAARMQR
ncbi:MAG: hypothetical protein SGPRY_009392 [Prymnesium sp.]